MSAPSPMPQRYGRWSLVSRLAAGAFGDVWVVTDDRGTEAVLKRLGVPPGEELAALQSVGHPGVVRALDAGEDPEPYLVMERALGIPEAGPMEPERVKRLVAHLADALSAVHRAGLVHGDIKPDNVLVDGDRAVLIDFGLAGGGGGTARFASPEVLSGGEGTPAADVFAMGRTALSWLDGPAALDDHAARPVAGDEVVREWVGRMLATAPGSRPSAEKVADGLVASGTPLPPLDAQWVERASEAALRRVPSIPRLGAGEVHTWVEHAVCATVADRVAPVVLADTGGERALLADAVWRLIQSGALVRRQRRWEVDPIALGAARYVEHPLPEDLTVAEQEVLAAIALVGPVREPAVGFNAERLLRRTEAGWCVVNRRLEWAILSSPVGQRVAREVLPAIPASDGRRRLWAAAIARDGRAVEAFVTPKLMNQMGSDPTELVVVTGLLAGCSDHEEVRLARVRALLAVGRAADARDAADVESVPMVLEYARAVAVTDSPSAARTVLDGAVARFGPDVRLLEAIAESAFRDEDWDACIRASEPLLEDDVVDRALHARGLIAQSVHARDGAAAALDWLDVDPHLGAGTSARGVYDGVCGRLLWHAGKLSRASLAFERAAKAPLSLLERARLTNNAGLAAYLGGDLSRAMDGWSEALVLFERLERVDDQIRVLVNLCQGGRETGRWERARQAGERAVQLAEQEGLPAFRGVACGNLGDLALARGDTADARDWWGRAASDVTDEEGKAELARRYAEAAVVDEHDDALALAQYAVTVAESADGTVERSQAKALLCVLHARAGRVRASARAYKLACAPLIEQGATGVLATVRLWGARASLAMNRNVEAFDRASQVIAYADEVGHVQLRHGADEVFAALRERNGTLDATAHGQLAGLSQELSRDHDPHSVLERVARAALTLLQCDRAYVLRVEDGVARVVATALAEGMAPGAPSMSVVERCLRLRREILAMDIDERGDLRAAQSVVALDLQAALCAPLLDGGQVLGVVYADARARPDLSFVDATDLLRALASQAASALLTAQLLADREARLHRASELAHDIRSPLASVLMLLHDIHDEEAAEPWVMADLPAAIRSLERVASMANQVLGHDAGAWQDVSVSTLLDDLVVQVRRVSRRRAIGIELSRTGDATVRCDPNELTRALNNVLANAVKYAPDGSRIDVDVTVRDDVTVVVRDRGAGFPVEVLATLFERGQQGEGALPGYGLGLAIAERIAQDMGGRIHANNHPDGGAVVSMMLPVSTKE